MLLFIPAYASFIILFFGKLVNQNAYSFCTGFCYFREENWSILVLFCVYYAVLCVTPLWYFKCFVKISAILCKCKVSSPALSKNQAMRYLLLGKQQSDPTTDATISQTGQESHSEQESACQTETTPTCNDCCAVSHFLSAEHSYWKTVYTAPWFLVFYFFSFHICTSCAAVLC